MADANTAQQLSLHAADGHRIVVDIWQPERPSAQIHLLHGLGEHPARYARFAGRCNEHGFSVAAHCHRGHGPNCSGDELGHYADENGWNRIISDAAMVQDKLAGEMPGIPLILLGHSMGSYIAQSFVMRGKGEVSAMILSGSTFAPRLQLRIGHWLAAFERWRRGGRARSDLLNNMGFTEFNKRFAPNRTAFDWLSRDGEEVDKYVADPLCGAESSGGLWYDLTGGLLEITSDKALRKIPANLPILITGGADDPVGGLKGMTRLGDAYRKSGHDNVTLKIYPEGRHEMFNEINRDEFTADLIRWMSEAAFTRNG